MRRDDASVACDAVANTPEHHVASYKQVCYDFRAHNPEVSLVWAVSRELNHTLQLAQQTLVLATVYCIRSEIWPQG